MCIEEMVAMFLHICAHDVKSRDNSLDQVKQLANNLVGSWIRYYDCKTKKPEPVEEDCIDDQ